MPAVGAYRIDAMMRDRDNRRFRWTPLALIACMIAAPSLAGPDPSQDTAPEVQAAEQVQPQPNAQLLREERAHRAERLLQKGLLLASPPFAPESIMLVRVIKLDPVDPSHATVKVLKSWRGPFSVGRILRVGVDAIMCGGQITYCSPYLFQARDNELLIYADPKEPLFISQGWVWPAVESQALMQALDQAAKETQELQAPHPKAIP